MEWDWKSWTFQPSRSEKLNVKTSRLPASSAMPRLPNEILTSIFEYLDPDRCRPIPSYGAYSKEKPKFTSLLRVCRQWKAIAEPILYRRIQINFDDNRLFPRMCRTWLLATFKPLPLCWSYVRELELLYSNNGSEASHSAILQIFKSLTGSVRKLSLEGCWDRNSVTDPRLFLQVALMRVEELQLRCSWGVFLFEALLRYGDNEQMQSLKLDCFPWPNYSQSDYRVPSTPPYSQIILPVDRQFSGSLMSIEIRGCDLHVDALCSLLRWPACLKILILAHLVHHCYSSSYRTRSLQRLVDLQKPSLETIELGIYGTSMETAIPHLAAFSCLRRICVSDYNLFQDTASVACRKLASPLLEHITIDLDNGDQQGVGYGSFDADSAKWLEDFARCRRDYYPDFELREIYVIFLWDGGVFYCNYETWPNSVLASTKPVLADFSINLTWSEPYLSEEQWKQELEAWRNQDQDMYSDEVMSDEEEEQIACYEVDHNWNSDWEEDDQIGMVAKLPKMLESGQQRICSWVEKRDAAVAVKLCCSQHM